MKPTRSAADEFVGVNFGDLRLDERLKRLVPALAARPSDSFPEATGSVSALEATYRFLGNEKVTPERILAPHVEATIGRALRCERVVIAHDTTELIFPGKSRREELGWSKRGNQGFLAHVSLAISRQAAAIPLGVLATTPFFRTGEPKRSARAKKVVGVETESARWRKSVHETESLFPSDFRPIHVMDREADDYELISDLCEQKMRFVVRASHDRVNCRRQEDGKSGKLLEVLSGLSLVCEREVPISKKTQKPFPIRRKGEKSRTARLARLRISATAIIVPRSTYALRECLKEIALNCVYATEIDAPPEVDSIEWMLFTTEPIDTEQNVIDIVDDYRARWRIEEFFKALKTGCAYEKRQLESRVSLLTALAVFTPIAWQMLTLRTLHRLEQDVSVECALTKTQIEVLTATSKRELPDAMTAKEALTAIAALGGHIPNNGAPGWIVLSRGMENLLMMEIGWVAARGRCDQS